MRQTAKIKEWAIEYHPYYKDHVLTGIIFDHPKYNSQPGKEGVTSAILTIDFKAGKVETANTDYTLVGEPKTFSSFERLANENSN